MSSCPSCGATIVEGRRFCTSCGTRLPLACPACATPADPGDRFCGNCGTPLTAPAPAVTAPAVAAPAALPAAPDTLLPPPPSRAVREDGERKQLTVLFADVQGSMDMQEDMDPEEWAGIMDRFVGLLSAGITRFEGRVDKFTGDGVMALFGAPIALEDHAERACWAALDLISAIAGYTGELRGRGLDFHVRIGLNSGEVVVGRVGDNLHVDPTALGPTVELAQRMEALAEPDRVFLSEHTARLIGGRFALSSLGRQTVRGAREPIEVFRLEGVSQSATRTLAGDTAFVGRTTEVALLEQAVAQAGRGQAQIVGVAGEAGVGKTRLCQEFCDTVVSRGIRVVRTNGVAYGKGVPWLPALMLLRNYFRILEGDDPATARKKISARLLAIDAGFDDDLPLLFDFLEVKDPERPSPPLAADIRMDRILAALTRLTSLRSDRETLVMLVEDLHWFDPQSEQFLERWLATLPGSRTLVIVTFRPGVVAPWMEHSYYDQLSLHPLSADQTTEMLQDTLGDDPSLGPLLALVGERCGGNPFFLQEVVRAMVEEGTLSGEPGAYRLERALDQVRVPPTVHAVLAARIDRLVADQKSVLQTASVIGRTFAEPLLAEIADMADQELQLALRGLCAAEMLQPAAGETVAEYRFWQALTQEVAYDTQLASRRRRLHAAVAEAMEQTDPGRQDENAAVLAWHWEHAGNPEQAATWSLRAADYVLRTDIGEALRRLRLATTLLKRVEQTPPVLAMALRARIRLLQFGARFGMTREESERLAVEGRDLAEKLGDIALKGVITLVSGSPLMWSGDVKGASKFYFEAAELGALTPPPHLRSALLVAVPLSLIWLGPLPEALAANERFMEACQDTPDAGVPLLGYSTLAVAWWFHGAILARIGRLAEAAPYFDKSIALSKERGDTEAYCWGLAFKVRFAWFRGDPPDIGSAEEAVRTGHLTGNIASKTLGLEAVALAHLTNGNAAEAADACERALRESRAIRSGLFEEATVLDLLGQARLGLGDGPGALAAANDAVAVARRQELRVSECQVVLGRARVLRGTGDPEAAAADLDAAAALAEAMGYAALAPFIEEERGRLRGDREALARAVELFAAMGAEGHVARLRSELQ
ncbi:MAG: hypothetical protein QOH36_1056 [Actinomycetota bacterium]|nr:hypothetical protein [Actinomycetota bacterium]